MYLKIFGDGVNGLFFLVFLIGYNDLLSVILVVLFCVYVFGGDTGFVESGSSGFRDLTRSFYRNFFCRFWWRNVKG